MYNYPYYGQMPMAQPIQQAIQPVQKSAQFYSVESVQELDGVRPNLNVLYVGFNKRKKEIYVKQLTNDGLISLETYNLADDKKEKSEFETILEKINNLESKLTKGETNVPNNTTNGSNGNADANVGEVK